MPAGVAPFLFPQRPLMVRWPGVAEGVEDEVLVLALDGLALVEVSMRIAEELNLEEVLVLVANVLLLIEDDDD